MKYTRDRMTQQNYQRKQNDGQISSIEGKKFWLANVGNGSYNAIANKCNHTGGPLEKGTQGRNCTHAQGMALNMHVKTVVKQSGTARIVVLN